MSTVWILTLVGVALMAWAALRLWSIHREEDAWRRAPEALERARAALREGDRTTGWIALQRALPAGFIQLDQRRRCEHIAQVLEAAIGHADTLGLGEERWWVLAAAASRLRQEASPRYDRDMNEAERELVEQAVRTIRTRGRAALRGEVRDAVREARRAIEGDPEDPAPPRASVTP